MNGQNIPSTATNANASHSSVHHHNSQARPPTTITTTTTPNINTAVNNATHSTTPLQTHPQNHINNNNNNNNTTNSSSTNPTNNNDMAVQIINDLFALVMEQMTQQHPAVVPYQDQLLALRLLLLKTDKTVKEAQTVQILMDSFRVYTANGRGRTDVIVLLAREFAALNT